MNNTNENIICSPSKDNEILKELMKILNITKKENIIENINYYKENENFIINIRNLYMKYNNLNISFNNNNSFNNINVDNNNILNWINYLIESKNKVNIYEDYCKKLMNEFNIQSFNGFSQFLSNLLYNNKQNQNFLNNMKKILLSKNKKNQPKN